MKRLLATLAVGITLATLAACGGSSPPMNGDAAKELQTRVTAVRTAVVARDADGAERALADLRQAVTRLRRDDALSDERAAELLAAAGDVDDQLVTITTTTTTTTTTTAPPPAPAPVDDKGKGPKGGDDQGKGKGKD